MSRVNILARSMQIAAALIASCILLAIPRISIAEEAVGMISLSNDADFFGPTGMQLRVPSGRYSVLREGARDLRLVRASGNGAFHIIRAQTLNSGSTLHQPFVLQLDGADRKTVAIVLIEGTGTSRITIGGRLPKQVFDELLSTRPVVHWARKSLLIRSAEFVPEGVDPDISLSQRWAVLGSFGEATIYRSNGRLVSPVRLPDHAVAYRITAHFVDTSSSTDVTLRLRCIVIQTGWCPDDSLSDTALTSSDISPYGSKSASIRPYVVDDSTRMTVASLEPSPSWSGVNENVGIKAVMIDYLALRIVWGASGGTSLILE
jgi:hypothetical protein